MALAALVFLITEALLGAGLVLFNYVDKNQSVGRAFYLSLHLVNTLLLLGALALTARFSREAGWVRARRSSLVLAALPIAILVCVTGAIAALGDTLFPEASLAEGFRQDFLAAANFLLRLRILHPVFAVLAAVYFAGTSILVLRARQSRLAIYVLVLALAQLCAGAINVILLAPVWMQITHLLLADLVWIALVLLAVEDQPRALP
jgi:cytochrome c oxidase assembly protein subunit 15